MQNLSGPLNNLFKKGVKWNWTDKCQKAFEEIKKILRSDLSLAYYDPKAEIVLASDASDYGIGAVILHKYDEGNMKAVTHDSHSLLPVEKNYCQIEKEH